MSIFDMALYYQKYSLQLMCYNHLGLIAESVLQRGQGLEYEARARTEW